MNKASMSGENQPNLEDVALSLCALGRMDSSYRSSDGVETRDDCMAEMSRNDVHKSTTVSTFSDVSDSTASALIIADSYKSCIAGAEDMKRLRISDHVPSPTATTSEKKRGATKKRSSIKYNIKQKDPKRDTTVSFDEMKRLMRVYGSLKCLRNRTPKDSGKTVKLDSIKRKFYRWFPDFEERFEKSSDGKYKPKHGHEHEMSYREEMRKQDQQILVQKRNMKRGSKIMNDNLV